MEDKKIMFRASSFGNLMVESIDAKISESQLNEITILENEKINGVNVNGNKVKWTDVKDKKLNYLISKRDAPPQLSKTAKKEVEKLWRYLEKDYLDDIDSKYLEKGLLNEDDGIELLTSTGFPFIYKNDERKEDEKKGIQGECDVICNIDGVRTIIDIKSNWNLKSYMNAEFTDLYEYQLRCYMYLYNAEEAILAYTLTDTPQHLIEAEKRKIEYKYYSKDMSDSELQNLQETLKPLLDQVEKNLTYSNNPKYTEAERVKTFKIKRDLEIEKQMFEKVKLAKEYYKTIKIN